MRSAATLVAILLAAALVAGVPARAQHGAYGVVIGTVLDFEGKPAPNVPVTFVNPDNNQTFKLKTDKKGEFVGTGFMPGKYEIRVLLQGTEHKVGPVSISGGDYGNPSSINFKNKFNLDFSKMGKQQGEEAARMSEEQKKAMDSFDRAMAANRAGKYEDALADLVPLAEQDPTQWAVHAQMGVAYQNLKRYEEAEASYMKAIELQPSNPNLYSNLGQVYVKMNRQDDARRMFDTAAQLSPEDAASAYYNIAVTFINAGDMKSATDPLRKAVELDPGRADAHYWLGMALFNQSEYKTEGGELKTIVPPGCREAFERYLQLQPSGPRAGEAKQMLVAIDATVPASMRVKKK